MGWTHKRRGYGDLQSYAWYSDERYRAIVGRAKKAGYSDDVIACSQEDAQVYWRLLGDAACSWAANFRAEKVLKITKHFYRWHCEKDYRKACSAQGRVCDLLTVATSFPYEARHSRDPPNANVPKNVIILTNAHAFQAIAAIVMF